MPQYNLFGEIEEPVNVTVIEPEPEEELTPEEIEMFKEMVRNNGTLGKPFKVVRCKRCSQLIMVDPTYFHLKLHRDTICEACDPKQADKYLRFIKLNIK